MYHTEGSPVYTGFGSGCTVAIAGLGLMGGSLAMALKRLPEAPRVFGYDCSEEAVSAARELEAVDRVYDQAGSWLADVDVAIVAVPVGHIPRVLLSLSSFMSEQAVISDMGSTKQEIMKNICALPAGADGPVYIGGHPMTGSERSGIINADPLLYDNAVWLLVPHNQGQEGDLTHGRQGCFSASPSFESGAGAGDNRIDKSLVLLKQMALALGARPVVINPSVHDRIVGTISHLPHVVAALLSVQAATEAESDMLAYAGGGFRDTTRIAGGDPDLWTDILLSNRAELAGITEVFVQELEEIRLWLRDQNREKLRNRLLEAVKTRGRLRAATRGLLPTYHEITVRAENRPGIIAEVTRELALREINISDIEVLMVREGESGALRLGFSDAETMQKATTALRILGYVAVQR